MNHVAWAFVAMLAYAFVAPLVRRAIEGGLPGFLTLAITSTILGVAAIALAVVTGDFRADLLASSEAAYAYGAGLFLTVGIAAYYHALSLGAVSVVVPIFGLFLVVSPVLGIVLLGEAFTVRKAAGIVLAALAAYLVAG